MVTKEELRKLNPVYDKLYGVWDSDVNKANRYISMIEKQMEFAMTPHVGDMVIGEYYHGKHFDKGVIEKRYDQSLDVLGVCYEPYTPFVVGRSIDDEAMLSVSGGPFTSAHKSMFEPCGETERMFCAFGHNGGCKDGAFNFLAKVRKWKLINHEVNYPWVSIGASACIVENPRLVYSADYRPYAEKGDLFNVYFDNEKKVKGCCVFDGCSVKTSIQRLEYKLSNDRSDVAPNILALKYVVGEWLDVKSSKAFKSENEMNHKRYAVVTMATEELTDEPSLCLQLHDGEFVYVNEYIGLRKVCTEFDHIS